MEKYTLDRFEGNQAVILLRRDESIQSDIPRDELPIEAKEGDILNIEFDSNENIVSVKILIDDTDIARQKAEDLLKKILDKNN